MDLISSFKKIIYVIFHYNFNTNLFDIIQSIENFLFAFCSQSQQNIFKLYIIYDNFFMEIFPHKPKDYALFLTINYNEIKENITKTLKNFFSRYEILGNTNKKICNSSTMDQIFKLILLETNKRKSIDNNIILIISDCTNGNKITYQQKLLYLLKKNKIEIDCIHLGEHNFEYNRIFESLSFYCDGIFENIVLDNEHNLTQILLQQFLPLPGIKKKTHIQSISREEEKLQCERCPKREGIIFFVPRINLCLCIDCFECIELKNKNI